MAKTVKDKRTVVATLDLVVHYHEDVALPSDDELQDIVEKAREGGQVVRAEFRISNPVVRNLV